MADLKNGGSQFYNYCFNLDEDYYIQGYEGCVSEFCIAYKKEKPDL